VSRLVGPLTFGQTIEADLTFSNIEVTRDDELLRVTGNLKNNDPDTLDNLRVCVVVRNEDGDVTRVDVDNNEFDDVEEDEVVNFSVDTEVPDDEDDVDVVDLYADGHNADEDDQVTEPVEDLDNDVEVCSAPPNTSTATATNTPTPGTGTSTPTPTNTPDDAC
jgi:hypothetical protein